ncbi:MAG: HDIG domain-containing protein [Candidatus Nezhaarchaeota archaeon]|nr:HDIG domain-containing protein [Candidatus Nezhaarchaeota archaeon]
MKREEALRKVRENVLNEKIVLHMVAVATIMKALARRLNEDEELWELTGLLHDIDYELTKNDPRRHGLEAERLLKGIVRPEVINAIKAHNFDDTGVMPQSDLDKALIAADAVSGLIIATALVMPNKKLAEISIETLKRKFKQKDFARGVSRERIMFCEQIGIPLEEFLELSLKALKEESYVLGL